MLSAPEPRTRDPRKVKAGLVGAAVRWAGHDSKTVRLDDLTTDQRRLVLALVAAARETKETAPSVSETSPGAVKGGRRADVDAHRAA